MLGQYERFPQIVHGVGSFTYKISIKDLQDAIFQVFHRLNRESHDLSDIIGIPATQCKVSFEVGVAENISFNFIDAEEMERARETIQNVSLPILDFFCITRYHVSKPDGKKVPLKFDYYFLRFIFYQRDIELRIVHEKGTQHISLEDLVNFVVMQINNELSKKALEILNKRYLRTL